MKLLRSLHIVFLLLMLSLGAWADGHATFDYCGRSAFEDAFRTGWGKSLIYEGSKMTASFTTEYVYDSFGRILKIKFPDGEMATYLYDCGGQLQRVLNGASGEEYYVSHIGYDKFGQRTSMLLGDGTTTCYSYSPERRWLQGLDVSKSSQSLINNTYAFDLVGNITQATIGQVAHSYQYDDLYRLTSASGNYLAGNANYNLTMTYDNLWRITSKQQSLYQNGVIAAGRLYSGYHLNYDYQNETPGHHFQLESIYDEHYRSNTGVNGQRQARHRFNYDDNGNLIYENGTLTTLLFDGGYVSFVKTGTGTNATYTPTYHFYMKDHLGSNRVVASAAGVAEQVNHYYPYGSTFYGETTTDHRFKYCGKELDKMHGLDWYDSSARYYDHVLGRFHQVDPLAEKYYSWSPYAYCMGNPVNSIDNIGLYPEMIMKKYSGGLLRADYYKLSNPAAHLLSLISSVDEQYIRNINIMSIGIGRLYPWYDPNKGGGAVTLGDDPHHATITLTKNYFEDDASKYDNNGYGQNIYAWFDILGHEVKHLDHIAESGNKLSYVVKFFGAYMKMGHDNVPEEKEADLCRNRFNDFYNHVSKIYGVDSFKKLFSEKADKEIIQTIDLWWNDFKNIK